MLPIWSHYVAKLLQSCCQYEANMLSSCSYNHIMSKWWCQDAAAAIMFARLLQLPSCYQAAVVCCQAAAVMLLCCWDYQADAVLLLYAAAIRKLLPLCWEAAAVILAVIGEEEFVKVLSRVVTVRWREDFFIPETAVGGSNCFSISTIFTAT